MDECTLFIVSMNVIRYLFNALVFYHSPEIIRILKAGTLSYDGLGTIFIWPCLCLLGKLIELSSRHTLRIYRVTWSMGRGQLNHSLFCSENVFLPFYLPFLFIIMFSHRYFPFYYHDRNSPLSSHSDAVLIPLLWL